MSTNSQTIGQSNNMNTNTKSRRNLRKKAWKLASAVAGIGMLFSASARAADYKWTGAAAVSSFGSNTSWSDSGNWTGGGSPLLTTDNAIFDPAFFSLDTNSQPTGYNYQAALTGNTSINSLQFLVSDPFGKPPYQSFYTLNGNNAYTLTLNGTGNAFVNAWPNVTGSNNQAAIGYNVTLNMANGGLLNSGQLAVQGEVVFNGVASAAKLTNDGVGSFNKATFTNGGIIQNSGTISFSNDVAFMGSTGGGTITNTGAGTMTFGNLTFENGGAINNQSTASNPASTLIIYKLMIPTGKTVFPTLSGPIALSILDQNGTGTMTLGGSFVPSNSSLTIQGTGNTTVNVSLATDTGGGNIVGVTNLTKAGTGTLVLGQDYTPSNGLSLSLNQGELSIDSLSKLGPTGSNRSLQAMAYDGPATLTITGTNIANERVGLSQIGGQTNPLVSTATFNIVDANRTVTLTGPNSTSSANITGGPGGNVVSIFDAIAKTGAGTLMLSDPSAEALYPAGNTFTGNIRLDSGVVVAPAPKSLGFGYNTNVFNGGTLRLLDFIDPATGRHYGFDPGNAGSAAQGSAPDYTGTGTASSNRKFEVRTSGTLDIQAAYLWVNDAGQLWGPGTLHVANTGSLATGGRLLLDADFGITNATPTNTATGTVPFTGSIIIDNGGVVRLGNANGAGGAIVAADPTHVTNGGPITVNTGGKLAMAATGSVPNTINLNGGRLGSSQRDGIFGGPINIQSATTFDSADADTAQFLGNLTSTDRTTTLSGVVNDNGNAVTVKSTTLLNNVTKGLFISGSANIINSSNWSIEPGGVLQAAFTSPTAASIPNVPGLKMNTSSDLSLNGPIFGIRTDSALTLTAAQLPTVVGTGNYGYFVAPVTGTSASVLIDPVTLAAGRTLSVGGSNGTLGFSSAPGLTFADTGTLNVVGDGTNTATLQISAQPVQTNLAAPVVIKGNATGTVLLTNAQNYAFQQITAASGNLKIDSTSTLAVTGSLNFSGGTVNLSGGNTGQLTLGTPSTPGLINATSGASLLSSTGANAKISAIGGNLGINAATGASLIISAPIVTTSPIGLDINAAGGSGVVRLTGDNSALNGNITVNSGVLYIPSLAASAGLSGNTITLKNSGGLQMGSFTAGLAEGRIQQTVNNVLDFTTANPRNFANKLNVRMAERFDSVPAAGATDTSGNTTWGNNETWVYTGRFFDADGFFAMASYIDDRTWISIDGKVAMYNNNSWIYTTSTATTTGRNNVASTPGIGTDVANVNTGAAVNTTSNWGMGPNNDGWHNIEIRVQNGTGGAGSGAGNTNINGWATNYGFGISTGVPADPLNGGSYNNPVDPGDGSLFRTAGAALDLSTHNLDVQGTGSFVDLSVTDAGSTSKIGNVTLNAGSQFGVYGAGTTLQATSTVLNGTGTITLASGVASGHGDGEFRTGKITDGTPDVGTVTLDIRTTGSLTLDNVQASPNNNDLSRTTINVYQNGRITGLGTTSGTGSDPLAGVTVNVLGDGGALRLGSQTASAANPFIASLVLNANGRLEHIGTTSDTIGAAAGTATVVTMNGNTLTADIATGGGLTVSGQLTGTGTAGLTMNGGGTLTLAGATANTFAGPVVLNAGNLALNKPAGTAAIASTSIEIKTGATLTNLANNQINDAATLTMSGGTYELSGKQEFITTIVPTSGLIQSSVAGGRLSTFAGNGATVPPGLIKNTPGELIITAPLSLTNAAGAALTTPTNVVVSNGSLTLLNTGATGSENKLQNVTFLVNTSTATLTGAGRAGGVNSLDGSNVVLSNGGALAGTIYGGGGTGSAAGFNATLYSGTGLGVNGTDLPILKNTNNVLVNVNPYTGGINFQPQNADALFGTAFGNPAGGPQTGLNFSTSFVGYFLAPVAGTYSFALPIHDDGSALWIDKNQNGTFDTANTEMIINATGSTAGVVNTTTVNLAAGIYRFAVAQEDTGGNSTLQAQWADPGQALATITSTGAGATHFLASLGTADLSTVAVTVQGNGTLLTKGVSAQYKSLTLTDSSTTLTVGDPAAGAISKFPTTTWPTNNPVSINIGGLTGQFGGVSLGVIDDHKNLTNIQVGNGTGTASLVLDNVSSATPNSLTNTTMTVNFGGILQVMPSSVAGTANPLSGSPTVNLNGGTFRVTNQSLTGSATVTTDLPLTNSSTIEHTGITSDILNGGSKNSITLGGNTLTLLGTAGKLTINSAILDGSGTGNIVKSGPGIIELAGSTANAYTGTTTVNAGTLLLSKTGAGINNAVHNVTINAAGTVRLGQSNQLPDNEVLTINGGTLDLAGNTEFVSNFNSTGGLIKSSVLGGRLSVTATGLSRSQGDNLTISAPIAVTDAVGNPLTTPTTVTISNGSLNLLNANPSPNQNQMANISFAVNGSSATLTGASRAGAGVISSLAGAPVALSNGGTLASAVSLGGIGTNPNSGFSGRVFSGTGLGVAGIDFPIISNTANIIGANTLITTPVNIPAATGDANFGAIFGNPSAGPQTGANFSTLFTGYFLATTTGTYSFALPVHDDGSSVWIDTNQNGTFDSYNSEMIINATGTAASGTLLVNLTGGQTYRIAVAQEDTGGGSSLQLQWADPGMALQVVNPSVQDQGKGRFLRDLGTADLSTTNVTVDGSGSFVANDASGQYGTLTLLQNTTTLVAGGTGIGLATKFQQTVLPSGSNTIYINGVYNGFGGVSPGVISDGGSPLTFNVGNNTGSAALVLDNTAGTNSLANTTISVAGGGVLELVPSTVAGASDPLKGLPTSGAITLSGGTLLVANKEGQGSATTGTGYTIGVPTSSTFEHMTLGNDTFAGTVNLGGSQTLTLKNDGGTFNISGRINLGGSNSIDAGYGTTRITGQLMGDGSTLNFGPSAVGAITLATPIGNSYGTAGQIGTIITGTTVNAAGNYVFGNGSIKVSSGTLAVPSSNLVPNADALKSFTDHSPLPIEMAGGTLSLQADGNGLGTPESAPTYANALNFSSAAAAIALGPVSATPARNKTFGLTGPVSFTAGTATTLTVTNNNGDGVILSGPTSLSGITTFSVANASASNLVQGLTLSGPVSGAFNVIKTGAGTLALTSTANTFGGTGNIIDIQGGVVAASSDSALGNAANSIKLNIAGAAGVGFRATGTFATSRTFAFAQATNEIDVTVGNTLTLNSPFTFAGATNQLVKNENGTLELAAANPTTWTGSSVTGSPQVLTGGILVNAGVLKLSNAGAAGGPANIIAVNNTSGAQVQIAGGITVPNPLILNTQTGNSYAGGINWSGALRSVGSGLTNTWSGAISENQDSGISAEAGNTLNITGGITQNAHITVYGGEGTINVLTNPILTVHSLDKIGSGTTNIQVATAAPTGNGIRVYGGNLTFSGAGGIVSGAGTIATVINPGATLNLDSTAAAPTGGASRLGGRVITLQGGNLNLIGNATTAVTETIGAPSFVRGQSTITVTNAGAGTNLKFSAASNNVAPAQSGSPAGATALFRGTNLGSAAGAANSSIAWTAGGLLFNGQTGATGTNTKGLVPWAIIDTTATGLGTSFVTADGAAGAANTGTNILRPLATTEYSTATTLAANANMLITTALTGQATVAPNTLTIDTGGSIAMNALNSLSLSSGGVLIRNGVTTTIGGAGIVSLPGGNSPWSVHTVGNANLTINAVMTGGSQQDRVGLVKAGDGTMTLSTPKLSIAGLPSFNSVSANTLFMQEVVNQGKLVLNGGTNTLGTNNYLEIGATGTLDLNGNSQYVLGLFTDGVYNGIPGTVTSGGTLTNSSATQATFVTNSDARNWSGQITGNIFFNRTGTGTTTTIYTPQTYTGGSLFNGGTISLRDYATLANTPAIDLNYGALLIDNTQAAGLPDRVNDAAPITLRGGSLTLNGRAQTASTETVGVVTMAKGLSEFNVAGGGTGTNSADLILSGLVINPDATANIHSFGQYGSNPRLLVTGGVPVVNNIVTPAIESGGNEFATYIPGLGLTALGATGAPAYDGVNMPAFNQPTQNIRLTGLSAVVPAGGITLNTLNTVGGNVAFSADADTMNLVAGGLIHQGLTSTFGATVDSGRLTAGGATPTGTVPFYVYNGANTFTINSRIVDNGSSPVRMIFGNFNGGINTLTAANTYTGGTVVNGWIGNNTGGLFLSGAAGTVVIPAGGLTMNNGLVTENGTGGQIDPSNVVTMSGPSVLSLVNANTLAGLVINNEGGTGAPTVNTFRGGQGTNGTGTLTIGAAGITASSSNVQTTSIIVGRLDTGANPTTITVNPILVNGVSVAPFQASLAIQGWTGSAGTITKAGDGILQLNGQGVYTGQLNVTGGGINVGTLANNGLSGANEPGSRFSQLNLAAGTFLNLTNTDATIGSLSGAGSVINVANQQSGIAAGRTFNVGFDNSDTTFSGIFARTSDPLTNPYQVNKIGTGTMTLTGANVSAISTTNNLQISKGGVTFSGAGTGAFGTVFVLPTGTLTLDNSGTNVNNRLTGGTGTGGTLSVSGGTVRVIGNASAATNEKIGTFTLNASGNAYGPATVTLEANPAQSLTFTASAIGGVSQGTALIRGITATIGAGSANFALGTVGLGAPAGAGAGTNGSTNMPIRPDMLGDASITGIGTGFITKDTGTGGLLRPLTAAELAPAYVPVFGTNNNNPSVNYGLSSTQLVGGTGGQFGSLTLNSGGGLVGDGVSDGLAINPQVVSGGILAFSGNAGINVGRLQTANNLPFFFHTVGNSTTLAVNAVLNNSTGGIVKADGGTMTLNAKALNTGVTHVNDGTLILNGGDNTLPTFVTAGAPTVQALGINATTALVDLNGTNQITASLFNNNSLARYTGSAGTITNSSATPVLLTSIGSGGHTTPIAITGNLSFTKTGNQTLGLTGVSTYTGSTNIRANTLTLIESGALTKTSDINLFYGGLNLDNSGLTPLANLNPQRIPAAAPVTLRGSTLTQTAGGSIDTMQTLNTVNAAQGHNAISLPTPPVGGYSAMTIGNLQVNSDATVNLNGGNGGFFSFLPGLNTSNLFIGQINGVPTTTLTNGILPANILVNNSEFGTYVTAASTGSGGMDWGVITMNGNRGNFGTLPNAYNQNAATLPANNPTWNVRLAPAANATVTLPTGAMTTYNTLAVRDQAGIIVAFNAATDVLNLAAGGVALTTGTTSIGTTALRGVLTAGGSATTGTVPLYIHSNNATINSVIADNGLGAKTRLVANTGPGGTLTLTGTNTYTGGTVVNGGNTLALTTGTIPAGGLTINNSTVTTAALNLIATSNDVTINGGGVLTLGNFANTLNSVTFNNTGGTANPTVNVGTAGLTLSAANAITAVNDNAAQVPTIAGTLLNLPAGANISASTTALVPTDLVITAPISSTGAINKTGSGSLLLGPTTTSLASLATVLGNTSVTVPSTTGLVVGQVVTGIGVPIGATISSITDGTHLVLSSPANLTSTPGSFAGLATTNASATATVTSTVGMVPGQAITGTNIPAGTSILSVTNATTFVMTQNATAAGTALTATVASTGAVSGSIIAGGFNLNQGTLILGANSINNTGPVGSGTLTMADGTALISDTAIRTISNKVVLNGNITLGSTAGIANASAIAANSVALTGPVDLGTATRSINVNSFQNTSSLAGNVSSTTAGVGLTKTGPGTLVLSGTNSYTGPTTISSGTLKVVTSAPGLVEGLVADGTNAFDTTSPVPSNSIQLTPRWGANTNTATKDNVVGWKDNSTWGYTGYFNNSTGNTVTYLFGKNFDDSALLKIDGALVFSDGTCCSNFTARSVTLSPGMHSIEMRFGQGTGGAGANGAPQFGGGGIGYSTDGGTTYSKLTDPGNGSLLVSALGTQSIPSTSSVVMSSNTTFDATLATMAIGSLADAAGSPTGHQALIGGILTTGNDNTNTTFSGAISGAGQLVKTGTGIFTLTGTNTFAGGTTINSGTVKVGSTTSIPSGAGKGGVTVNGGATAAGTLDLAGQSIAINGLSGTTGAVLGRVLNSTNGTTSALTVGTADSTGNFAGTIADNAGGGATGTVSLTKIGTGSQTLSGPSTYTGGTTLNAGTLVVANTTGSATGTGNVTLNGGTLASGAVGSIAGAVLAGSGAHTIAAGGVGTIGVLNLNGGLTANNTTTFAFDLGAPVTGGVYTGDEVIVNGALTAGTATPVTLNYGSTYNVGDFFRLFGGTGIGSLDLNSLVLPSIGDITKKFVLSTTQEAGWIDLVIANNIIAYEWNGASSDWHTPANWYTFTPAAGKTAVFSHAGTASATVDLGNTDGTVGGLIFNDTVANTTIQSTGTGKLILDNLGSGVTADVTGSHSITAPMVSTALLTKTGLGTLTLGGDNSALTGGTQIDAGTLRTTNLNALGGSAATATVSAAGTLQVAASGLNLATLNNHGISNLTAGSSNITAIKSTMVSNLPTDGKLNLSAGAILTAGSINQFSMANDGKVTIAGSASIGSVIPTITGAGDLTVAAAPASLSANSIHQTKLTVNGTVNVPAAIGSGIVLGTVDGSGNTVTPGTLSLGAAGVVDLNDRPLVIHYDPAGVNPAVMIKNALAAGRNVAPGGVADGTWDGLTGIRSTTAAQAYVAAGGTEFLALGYGDTANMPFNDAPDMQGLASTVFVKYTRVGDASMDGIVGDTDVTVLGALYDPSYDPTGPGGPKHWYEGDFNYNGIVDDSDVTLLGANYDPTQPPMFASLSSQYGSAFAAAFIKGYDSTHSGATTVVPEPGALTLLGLGALGLIRRKRRQA